jgi:hypothetical protein
MIFRAAGECQELKIRGTGVREDGLSARAAVRTGIPGKDVRRRHQPIGVVRVETEAIMADFHGLKFQTCGGDRRIKRGAERLVIDFWT